MADTENVQLCFNTSEFRSYVPNWKVLYNFTLCGTIRSGDAPKTNQLFLGLTFHQMSLKSVRYLVRILLTKKHTNGNHFPPSTSLEN